MFAAIFAARNSNLFNVPQPTTLVQMHHTANLRQTVVVLRHVFSGDRQRASSDSWISGTYLPGKRWKPEEDRLGRRRGSSHAPSRAETAASHAWSGATDHRPAHARLDPQARQAPTYMISWPIATNERKRASATLQVQTCNLPDGLEVKAHG